MARAVLVLLPPYLLPQPDGSELPTAPNGGTLSTFDSATEDLGVTPGGTVDFCTTAIKADRTVQLEVSIELFDPAGAERVASGFGIITATRRGSGVVTLMGSPILLAYDPNVAPWTTVLADIVVAASTTDVVWRTINPLNIPVRVRSCIKILGAQAKVVS